MSGEVGDARKRHVEVTTALEPGSSPVIGDFGQFVIAEPDPVNHPPHYNAHPSGVECIAITEHMSFNVGNAIKYLWRADEKGAPLEDLAKARWYIDRELQRRTTTP